MGHMQNFGKSVEGILREGVGKIPLTLSLSPLGGSGAQIFSCCGSPYSLDCVKFGVPAINRGRVAELFSFLFTMHISVWTRKQ